MLHHFLKINNIICRVDKIDLPIKKGKVTKAIYRDCTVSIRKTNCVIFIKKHKIEEIFFDINFAKDFASCILEEYGVSCKSIPRVCNLQASKILNIERNVEELCKFLIDIHENFLNLHEIGISREGGAAFEYNTIQTIYKGELGQFISIQAKGKGFSVLIQTKKNKQNYVGSFVFSKFDVQIQKLFEQINFLY